MFERLRLCRCDCQIRQHRDQQINNI
jgi:hypothetical protein